MRIRNSAAALALAGALAACGSDDDNGPSGPGPTGTTVSASAASIFSPGTLDITVGQTVTWNFGPVDHNVMFDPVTGAPANIPATRNASVTRTFGTAGTFPYVCTLHPGMAGTIRVSAEASASSTVGYE